MATMKRSDTQPRIATRPGGIDGDVGLLIYAGSAVGVQPAPASRLVRLGRGILIGRDDPRSPAAQVDDAFLSRQHAEVGRAPHGAYWVRDLGSTNGTWVDGVRVPAGSHRRLRNGAVMMMGGQVFVFRWVTEAELTAMQEDAEAPFTPVPTASAKLALVLGKLRRLAPAAVDLLITGETGVGKEVHAEAVHRASGRSGPFLAINCAAIPENLVEGELFGYAAGAPGSADRSKPCLLEQADGGTLFLDEIAEMPLGAQTRLLRFLQNREWPSLGGTRPRTLDVRVIAATHRPVSEEDVDGRGGPASLRLDLAARLGPEPLMLPPLRDRPEDIGMLALAMGGVGPGGWTPEAYLALFLHSWKGNVRELAKVMAVARVLAEDGQPVELAHLPGPIAARVDARAGARGEGGRRKRPTRDELMALLARHAGDVARVAREIGRQRTLVWRWLREESVRVDDFR